MYKPLILPISFLKKVYTALFCEFVRYGDVECDLIYAAVIRGLFLMLFSTRIRTKRYFLRIWMTFLAFLFFENGTFANFSFTNYGMKRLSWHNAKKKFVGSNNEKMLNPLQLYCGRGWRHFVISRFFFVGSLCLCCYTSCARKYYIPS